MLRNYFKTAFRTLIRNKAFSLINILGLTISLSICLVIIKIIVNIYSCDRFHSNKDDIYRITTEIDQSYFQNSLMATSSGGLYYEFPTISGIEDAVRVWNKFYDYGKYDKNPVPVSGYFADDNFFQFFDFELKYGDPLNVLAGPNTIVLSHQISLELFDQENPIGKTISFKDYGDFTVTGVIENIDYKTHMNFDIIASRSSMATIESFQEWYDNAEMLDNANHVHNYIRVGKSADPSSVEQQLNNLTAMQNSGENQQASIHLQKLTNISPGPQLVNSLGSVDENPIMLSLVAMLLILSAGFTYNNLSVAKSISRAKEVGIRKINGARKSQLFVQFIIEAIILSLISLLLAILLLNLIIPFIIRLDSEFSSMITEYTSPIVYIYFICFAVLLGIVTGAFPALYITKFQPVTIVKSIHKPRARSKFSFKTSVIVFQFFISLMLLFGIIVLHKQFSYQKDLDLGFTPENVINIELQGVNYQNFENTISSHSGVKEVSAASLIPALGISASKTIFYHNDFPDSILLGFMQVSHNYFENMDIRMVAGRSFNSSSGNHEKGVVINENLSMLLGYDTPIDALGNVLSFSGKDDRTIIGVVQDFIINDLTVGIEPIVIEANIKQPKYAVVRLNDQINQANFITFLEKSWSGLESHKPISHSYHASEIEDYNSYSGSIMKFLGIITGFIILIAVLGLFGMVLYDTNSRTKEIGLRKVMGASIMSVLWTLIHGYLGLILLASILATPLSWLLNQQILTFFYDKVDLNPLWFLFGIVLMLIIGGLTTAAQSFKTAIKNPVNTLRYE